MDEIERLRNEIEEARMKLEELEQKLMTPEARQAARVAWQEYLAEKEQQLRKLGGGER